MESLRLINVLLKEQNHNRDEQTMRSYTWNFKENQCMQGM